jgi:LacI family transcriptional regulator
MTSLDRTPAPQPTMRDVAQSARVSMMTVSRVLRGEPGVSAETRSRVLDAVLALGYRPNEMARSLRLGRSTGLIGLVVSNLANPFYSELALGVEAYAAETGRRVILGNTAEHTDREQQLVHDFASRRVDGIIVVPAGNDHAHLAPAELGGLPVVLAASPPSNAALDLDAVLLDDFGGTREAVSRLIARGHRRIAFLGLPAASWTGSERFRGYCAAHDDAGIAIDNRYVRQQRPSTALAEQSTAELLALPEPPTALFTANNRNTIGACRALRRGPGRVDLAGFDNFELADLLPVPLTLVSYEPQELGRQAARLLSDRLQPNEVAIGPARRIVVPTELVEYPGIPVSTP